MELAGRNQLLASVDFPTGRSLGKPQFCTAKTAGTEQPLAREPVPPQTGTFFPDKIVIDDYFCFLSARPIVNSLFISVLASAE